MSSLFADHITEHNKKGPEPKALFGLQPFGLSPNLLYKRNPISAASPRGQITGHPLIIACDSLLPQSAGSGAEADRPAAAAGHDSPEQRAKEEIHRRWHISQ
jgi:hypothetical protein